MEEFKLKSFLSNVASFQSLNLDASSDDSFTAEPYYDNEEIEQRMLNDKANFSLFIAKVILFFSRGWDS